MIGLLVGIRDKLILVSFCRGARYFRKQCLTLNTFTLNEYLHTADFEVQNLHNGH